MKHHCPQPPRLEQWPRATPAGLAPRVRLHMVPQVVHWPPLQGVAPDVCLSTPGQGRNSMAVAACLAKPTETGTGMQAARLSTGWRQQWQQGAAGSRQQQPREGPVYPPAQPWRSLLPPHSAAPRADGCYLSWGYHLTTTAVCRASRCVIDSARHFVSCSRADGFASSPDSLTSSPPRVSAPSLWKLDGLVTLIWYLSAPCGDALPPGPETTLCCWTISSWHACLSCHGALGRVRHERSDCGSSRPRYSLHLSLCGSQSHSSPAASLTFAGLVDAGTPHHGSSHGCAGVGRSRRQRGPRAQRFEERHPAVLPLACQRCAWRYPEGRAGSLEPLPRQRRPTQHLL